MPFSNAHTMIFVPSVTGVVPFIKIVVTDVTFVQQNLMNRMALIRFVKTFVAFEEWFLMNEKTFLGKVATGSI